MLLALLTGRAARHLARLTIAGALLALALAALHGHLPGEITHVVGRARIGALGGAVQPAVFRSLRRVSR